MGVLDPLLILIGIAGVAFIVYAFTVIKVFGRNARMLGISLLVLLVILVGDRVLSPGFWELPEWIPGLGNPSSRVAAESGWQAIPFEVSILWLSELEELGIEPSLEVELGWQEIPSVIADLWLSAVADAGNSAQIPTSPVPPSPSPASPSPTVPVSPTPSVSPATPVIPAPASPSIPPISPAPVSPSPAPSPIPPSPTPPPRAPIPGWW